MNVKCELCRGYFDTNDIRTHMNEHMESARKKKEEANNELIIANRIIGGLNTQSWNLFNPSPKE